MSQTDVKKITEYKVLDTNGQPWGTYTDPLAVIRAVNNRAFDDRWSKVQTRTITTTVTTTTVTSDWESM